MAEFKSPIVGAVIERDVSAQRGAVWRWQCISLGQNDRSPKLLQNLARQHLGRNASGIQVTDRRQKALDSGVVESHRENVLALFRQSA